MLVHDISRFWPNHGFRSKHSKPANRLQISWRWFIFMSTQHLRSYDQLPVFSKKIKEQISELCSLHNWKASKQVFMFFESRIYREDRTLNCIIYLWSFEKFLTDGEVVAVKKKWRFVVNSNQEFFAFLFDLANNSSVSKV